MIEAQIGKHDSALEKAKEVLKLNPSDYVFFREFTKIALTQSREDIAELLVAIAQGSKIDDTSIFLVQGHISRRRNMLDKAEWYYQEAMDSTRNNAWPFYYLGTTLKKLGELDKAVDILHEGLSFCESRPWMRGNAKNAIQTQLGISYVLNDNLIAAVPIIENLIQESPENPEIVQAYALLIVKSDGKEKAAEAYEKFRHRVN